MRTQPSRAQAGKTENVQETRPEARKRQMRSWLILGAGAIGVVSAAARWAMQSRQATAAAKNDPRRSRLSDTALSQIEGTGVPVPLQGLPASAAPTNDARTMLVKPESAPTLPVSQVAAETPAPASTPKKSAASKSAKSASPPTTANAGTSTPSSTRSSSTSRKRGKMSEEYDQALQANVLPTDGQEGERLNQGMEAETMSGNTADSNFVNTQAGAVSTASSAPAPMSSSADPVQQALSTQAEGKMAVGEELRDREFPVPPQETGAAPQKVAIDQETMHDGGPRQGGVIGTISGDHQNKGDVGDIEDQVAKTPDLAQQR